MALLPQKQQTVAFVLLFNDKLILILTKLTQINGLAEEKLLFFTILSQCMIVCFTKSKFVVLFFTETLLQMLLRCEFIRIFYRK